MEAPYLKELKEPGSFLAFRNRRLEGEYRAFRVKRERGILRVQVLLGTLLICVIMLMDSFLMAPEFSQRAILLRAGFMLPPLLLMVGLTWSRHLQRWIQPVGVLAGLGVGLTSLVIGALAARYDQPRVFAGYQVVTVFVYFFLGLRVPVAMATAGSLLLAYLAAAVLASAHPVATAYNALFLLFLNVVGSVGAWQMDKSKRNEFLEDRILSYRANHDALTALPNRRAFDEVLETNWENAIEMRVSLAVMLIDIDHFKSYNDRYGHQAGDEAIREVAAILRDILHRPQDFAGRYGGEEFVVLLFDANKEYAMELAERIREQVLAKNIEHDACDTGCVSVSIGVACVAPHATRRSVSGFVQSADQALYGAKQGGRNCVVDADESTSTMSTGVFRIMQLGDKDVVDALGTDSG